MRKTLFAFLMLFFGSTVLGQTKVKFYTTLGDFELLLYDSVVPITAGNFIDLVEQKYYDGVIFHRVIDNFMIQGGDPTGTGSGGPGYTIDDEFDPTLSNVQGTISMANSGPNTGGSQFFINLVDNVYLDYDKNPLTSKHPVFGRVIDSFEVVQRIGKTPTNINNRPRTAVVMDSIRVINEPVPIEGNNSVAPNPLQHSTVLAYVPPCDRGISTLVDVSLDCISVSGKTLWSSSIQLDCSEKHIISLRGLYEQALPTGIYMLRISTDTDQTVVRVAVF